MGLAEELLRRKAGPTETDVTEISDLEVSKVAGVSSPANGVPFLLLKSQLDEQSRLIDTIKSDSQESDEVLGLVSGEEIEDESEEEQPRHPETGQFVTQDEAEDLAECEKAYAKATNPTEREHLAERVTLGRLKNLYSNGAVAAQRGNTMSATKSVTSGNMPALLSKLQKCVDSGELSPAMKSEALAVINQHRLRTHFTAKMAAATVITGRANDERAASIASIRAAQQSASTPAAFGTGSDPRAQVAAIGSGTGTPMSLGAVSPVGNRGDFDSPLVGGRVEPDPVVQAARLENELAKATNPFQKERLGDELTRVRLRMFYLAKNDNNGGDVSE